MNMNAGQWVRCKNGHRMAQLVRDVKPFAAISHLDFTNWRIQPGVLGGKTPLCHCGEVFVFRTDMING